MDEHRDNAPGTSALSTNIPDAAPPPEPPKNRRKRGEEAAKVRRTSSPKVDRNRVVKALPTARAA